MNRTKKTKSQSQRQENARQHQYKAAEEILRPRPFQSPRHKRVVVTIPGEAPRVFERYEGPK